ncbi:polysaccharide biosynthesis protein [Arthrobacter sp. C152]
MNLPWKKPAARPPEVDGDAAGSRTISTKSASGVGVASVVAAAAGFIILVIAGNHLRPEEYAQFSVFWGALFGIFGVLSGVQSETTRAVRSAESIGVNRAGTSSHPSVLVNGLVVGAIVALLLLASSWAWAPSVLGSNLPWLLPTLAVAAIAYSGHSALAGASAGAQEWNLYSRLMGAEALFRLATVGSVVLLGVGLLGLEFACALAAGLWLAFLLLSPTARGAAAARADVPRPVYMQQTGHAMLSSSATAALIVGFPVILSFTSTATELASAGGLLLAIQLTRAPIMVPLQAFQGVAIAAFVNQRDRGIRALYKPAALFIAVGVAGGIAAGLLGPWLMDLLFPGKYDVPAWLLAALTFDAALMAILTLTGTAALAVGIHRAYSIGWVSGTAVSVLCLLLPLPLSARTALALAAGPAFGAAIHIASIVRRGKSAVAASI